MKKFNLQKLFTAIGTAILLGSWIVEHYWAAHWVSLKDHFERARENMLQVEIHESVTAAMHQYTANLEPFSQRILTTTDLHYLVKSFGEMATSLQVSQEMTGGVDVPIPKADEVQQIIIATLIVEFPQQAESILDGTGNEKLTLDQIRVGGELIDMANRWAKAQQMFQAADSLYYTTISRLQRNALNAAEVPGGEFYAKRFEALGEEIASSRERFYKTGVVLEPGSRFVNEANTLRLEFGTFLRARSAELVAQETRYKGWHRIMYLIGSVLIFVGILLRKETQVR